MEAVASRRAASSATSEQPVLCLHSADWQCAPAATSLNALPELSGELCRGLKLQLFTVHKYQL
eukprot:3059195-Rhodomonas_salina.2